MKNKLLLISIISLLLVLNTTSAFIIDVHPSSNAVVGENSNTDTDRVEKETEGHGNMKTRSSRAMLDVPFWQVGDSWTYYVIIYSYFTDNADYISLWCNVTQTVSDIEYYNKNGTLYPAYNLTLTGDVLGKFCIEGDVYNFDGKNSGGPDANQKGTITGYRIVRTSDLAVLYDEMHADGHMHVFMVMWFAFLVNIEFTSWPAEPIEEVDFPALPDDCFWFNTTRRRTVNIDVPAAPEYSEHLDVISPYNFTVNGTSNIQETVIAGTFDTYYLEADSYLDDEKEERWYSPVVKNTIRENKLGIKTSSTGIMNEYRQLRSYAIAQVENSIDLLPSTNLPDRPTRVSGSFPNDPNEDIVVLLPYTGDMWAGTTDANGDFDLSITSPTCFDATNTTIDIGSFGVSVLMNLDPDNKVVSRTLTIVDSDPVGPTADAGSSLNIPEDTPFMFNASRSSDDRAIANFTWEYDSTTGHVSFYGRTPMHTFTLPGNYSLTLTVIDIGGNVDSDSIYVNVFDITPPVVLINHQGNVAVDMDTSLFLDGSASYDPEEGVITDHSWWITTPSGSQVTLDGANVSYRFQDAGRFEVNLNVTDSWGNIGRNGFNVTVIDSILPIADAGENITVDQGENVTLNGNGSIDNVGIVRYNWSFVYDGSAIDLTGMSRSFVFITPGEYIITLTVTDEAGNWAVDTVVITVIDVTDPIANAGMNQTVDEGMKVIFDGSYSYDNVGIVEYEWSFLYDENQVNLAGPAPSFTFGNVGEYDILLTVTDAAGNRDEDGMTIEVLDITPPVADAKGDIVTGPSELVYFNGTGSWDNVGIKNYTWIFVYDNETVMLNGSTASFRFDLLDTYIVCLKVMDAAGNRNSTSIHVTVKDLTPPKADAGGDVSAMVGDTLKFDAANSSDDIGILDYTWVLSFEGSEEYYYGIDVSIRFDKLGNYSITLNVTDGGGNWAVDEIVVTVTQPPKPEDGDPDTRASSSFLGTLLIVIFVAVLAIVVAVFFLVKRKKKTIPDDGGTREADPWSDEEETLENMRGSVRGEEEYDELEYDDIPPKRRGRPPGDRRRYEYERLGLEMPGERERGSRERGGRGQEPRKRRVGPRPNSRDRDEDGEW